MVKNISCAANNMLRKNVNVRMQPNQGLLHQYQSKVHINEKGLYKCKMFTASSIRRDVSIQTDVSMRIDVSAYTNSWQRV
jgi:hypothetical protein